MLERIFICIDVTAWLVQSLKFFSILQEPEAKEKNVSRSYLIILPTKTKQKLPKTNKKPQTHKNQVYFEGIAYITSKSYNLDLLPVCYNLAIGYTCS